MIRKSATHFLTLTTTTTTTSSYFKLHPYSYLGLGHTSHINHLVSYHHHHYFHVASNSSSSSSSSSYSCLANEEKPHKKVALAMSGGVDSCMAAYLLLQQGYNVTGFYMQNWDKNEETGLCQSDQDWLKVQQICKHFNIPCFQLNFVKEYWNYVFARALHAYELGETPNPDVFCNKYIKFGTFIEKTLGTHHFDYVATGHYADVHAISPTYVRLRKPVDQKKDQTYFLAAMKGSLLRNILFPLANFHKHQIKSMAIQLGLSNIAQQKESMGICFIGEQKKFGAFLQEYLVQTPGNFIALQDGSVLGQHQGLWLYTIGQCARLPGLKNKFVSCFNTRPY